MSKARACRLPASANKMRPLMDPYQRRGSDCHRAAWEGGAVKGEAAKPERSSP